MVVIEEETEESVGIPDYAGVNSTLESLKSKAGFCQNHVYYSEALFDVSNSTANQKLQLFKILVWKKWQRKKPLHFLSSKTRIKFPTLFFLQLSAIIFNICASAEALAKHNW